MNPVLVAACRRMVEVHGATLVVAYGSFASGTADAASDIDLVAWAPVSAPVHDTTPLDGRDLDAWVYPLDHPFDAPDLVRVFPSLCLHDTGGRFPGLEAAVGHTRTVALAPFDTGAKADLAAWARKMVVRAHSGTVEGHQRYHWLVAEGPELWCRFSDQPWEGPKKALAQMRQKAPGVYDAYAQLGAGGFDPVALQAWIDALVP